MRSACAQKCAVRIAFILTVLILGFLIDSAHAQTLPGVVSSRGYIEGSPLGTHTTASFDSRGATTLIAFVSTHPTWNGQPVSISGVTDSVGNIWQVLTGPTTYVGSAFTLQSAIYYVSAPITNASHSVTISLTNVAPLVAHVVAVEGTDVTKIPTYSAITDPGTGQTSSDAISAQISVRANSLLLSWVKNDMSGAAAAMDGFTLDPQSSSFLWAEEQVASVPGSFSGHFQFDRPVGWQTAIVGLMPPVGPVTLNEWISTDENVTAAVTLQGESPSGGPLVYAIVSGPLHGTLTGMAPDLSYTPASQYIGADSFTYKANDGTGDSNISTVSITVRGPNNRPVASNSNVTVVGSSGPLTLSAVDADGDPLTYTIVTPPIHGQLSNGTGPGRIYTATTGYVGLDSFTFKVNDGQVDSNIAMVSVAVQAVAAPPAIVGSRAYQNSTALGSHTSAAFDSTGASTLIAFVSTHPSWGGQPVSIGSVTDSAGNIWNLLTGPTSFTGGDFDLLSSIYYVTSPVTSPSHTLTVNLTNPSPTVMHVFAVAGTDVTSLPIYSPITDPGVGWVTTDVTSASITVPTNALLLSWVKNDTDADAVALSGYTLDPQSTGFLWAESQVALTAGAYAGHFQYSTAIGWQTALVGLKPPVGLVAFDQSLRINHDTPVNVTLEALSSSVTPLVYHIVSGPLHGALTGLAPNLTYTPNAAYVGADSFTFKANDGTVDSNTATVSITVRATNHAPVSQDSAVAAASPIAFMLNATDADGDPLSYIIVTPPAHGQISGSGANRVYTPAPQFIGTDSFTFKVNDGSADSNVAVVTITVHETPLTPVVVGSVGYLNSSPLTAHTTAAFDSRTASALVAFISTNAFWSDLPVSIAGVSDNAGNVWKPLVAPAVYQGSLFTMLSGVYYVSSPVTSASHVVTIRLSNGAPLVAHVAAIAGTDPATTPMATPIADPGPAVSSPDVVTAPLAVSSGAMLLAWVRNEANADASAADSFVLDSQSTSFLWAEAELANSAGTYVGHFVFDASIAWQAALVALKPIAPFNPITVTVTAPNGGNKVFAGISTPITWSASGSPTSFDVAISIDGGASFTPIPGCTGLAGATTSCAWTPLATATAAATIQLTAHGPGGASATDRSDALFTIVVPSISIASPAGGETWVAGTIHPITWDHNLGATSSVRLELSRDGGATWQTVASSVQNAATTGSYLLTITNPATSAARVRLTWLGGPASGASSAFSIVAPVIAMTSPTTSSSWQIGSTHAITFTHNLGAGQPLTIESSHDDGATWTSIGTFTTTSPTIGTLSWLVNGAATNAARVRATWNGVGLSVSADARFAIVENTTAQDDLVVSFESAYGIWQSHGGVWNQLHWLNAKALVPIKKNSIDQLVVDFGPGVGLWIWTQSQWVQIHSASPSMMTVVDFNGTGVADLVADFQGYGLWRFDGANWTLVHASDVSHLAAGNLDGTGKQTLIADFPGYGVWMYKPGSWSQLHPLDVTSLITADLDGNGRDDVVMDFPQHGLWEFRNGQTWLQIHTLDATHVAAGDVDGNGVADLIIDFGSYGGIWTLRNATTWSQMHTLTSRGFVTGDLDANGKVDVIIDFGTLGLWDYDDLRGWQELHQLSPAVMAPLRVR